MYVVNVKVLLNWWVVLLSSIDNKAGEGSLLDNIEMMCDVTCKVVNQFDFNTIIIVCIDTEATR